MNFNDPFVKGIWQAVLLLTAACITIPSLLALAVAIDFQFELGPPGGNATLVRLARLLPSVGGPEIKEVFTLGAIVITALPLVATSVAFRADGQTNQRVLNIWGRVLVLLFVVCLITATVAFLMIKPADWRQGHDLGESGLISLQEWAKAGIRGAVFYIGTLLGIKVAK